MPEDDASITYYLNPRGIKGNFDALSTPDATTRRHKHKTNLESYGILDCPLAWWHFALSPDNETGLDLTSIQEIKTGFVAHPSDQHLPAVETGHYWTTGLAILISARMPDHCMTA